MEHKDQLKRYFGFFNRTRSMTGEMQQHTCNEYHYGFVVPEFNADAWLDEGGSGC